MAVVKFNVDFVRRKQDANSRRAEMDSLCHRQRGRPPFAGARCPAQECWHSPTTSTVQAPNMWPTPARAGSSAQDDAGVPL